MNDNDNANMYEIFERLNRVQAMPSKIDEAAARAAEKTRLDESAFQAAIGKKKYGDEGMKALQKAGRDHASDKTMKNIRNKYDKYDEGMMTDEGNAFSKAVVDAKRDGVQKGEKIRVGGKELPLKEKMSPARSQKFAALAPPKDKITFADKIAGAKQEVDEMLGDVAADAIKKAISTHKGGKVSGAKGVTKHSAGADVYGGSAPDKGHAVDRMKGPSDKALGIKRKQTTDEDFPTVADAEKRLRDKEGKTTKGTVTKTAAGLRHTRDYEHDVEADDDKSSSGEKRSAGRPKKYSDDAPRQERVTAKSRKTDRTAHGQAGFKKDKVKENNVDMADQGEYDQEGDMAKDQLHTLVQAAESLSSMLQDNDNLPEWVQSKITKAVDYINASRDYMDQEKHDSDDQEPVAEKAVSKKQQRFMGMARAMQKGEKISGAGKELKKVAKTMKKGDVEDFAKTKHKGLPEKAKKKKEESVEETTTSGSVAAASSSGNSKGGMSFGKGIYDSIDRKVESIIAESMSINMSTSTEGGQTITVTASDEDAMKLASLLKMAGIGSGDAGGSCDSCGQSPCGCDHVDENAPDWPTNKEYNNDALQYAGGLNKPKETGQTTAPVIGRDARRQHTPESEELTRIREIAGLKEAAKPDFLDMDKDGDKEEPMKKAVKDKDEEKKVEESIFALTNQWRAYKS